jgi:site-specific recombinase XerD
VNQNVFHTTEIKTLFSDGAHVSLRLAVETFLRMELIGRSEQTRLWYRRKLYTMLDGLGDRPLADLMEADLLSYYASLAERMTRYGGDSTHPVCDGRLSTYTLHGHLRAMKRFYSWLHRKDILPVNLAAGLDLPRLPRSGRKGISEANLSAILEAAGDSPRDSALLLFLESTGVRRGGVESLCLDDLNLDNQEDRIRRRVSVREKGEKERTVIMSHKALEALSAWLMLRPEVDDDHVFLGSSPGQPWHALKADGISGIVARYKKRLGLRGPCSPHQWRHRWARHRLHKGMELSQVSQLLGHEDVAITVKFYGQFTVDQLQEAYDRYSDE